MTEQERQDAERLARDNYWDGADLFGVNREARAFVAGYAAACKAKQGEILRAHSECLIADDWRIEADDKLKAERARSAKLIEALRECALRDKAAGLQGVSTGACDFANEAIAEYEASRG